MFKNVFGKSHLTQNISLDKTAFRTQDSHFQFQRIPSGLKNAHAACVRLMNRLVSDWNFARAYMDDICIFSDIFDEHIEH